jgi:Skp family chaperone for outer membrane proteins
MRFALALAAALAVAAPSAAQTGTSPTDESAPMPAPVGPNSAPARPADTPRISVVVLDLDALFAGSAFGRRVRDEIEQASATLAAENRRIEAELVEEEQRLTERRAELPREEFEALADAFDSRVEVIRQDQDSKGRAIAQRSERAETVFLDRVNPLLVSLAREVGALVILDRRTVLASADGVDITELALTRIDEVLGDGAGLEPGPVRRPIAGQGGEIAPGAGQTGSDAVQGIPEEDAESPGSSGTVADDP